MRLYLFNSPTLANSSGPAFPRASVSWASKDFNLGVSRNGRTLCCAGKSAEDDQNEEAGAAHLLETSDLQNIIIPVPAWVAWERVKDLSGSVDGQAGVIPQGTDSRRRRGQESASRKLDVTASRVRRHFSRRVYARLSPNTRSRSRSLTLCSWC